MSTADRDYDEKRDFIRMRMNTQAHIFLEGESTPISAHCQDFSAVGMSLIIDKPLPIGTQIRVVIESPNEHLSSLDAQAEVVRCDADGQQYRHGVEIRGLD
ncbi:PilZ domain-containing protein [Saccharospirillum mangrovi]|uniref:PilZ domain-containing protein n=1 Tax=Saccharospirillum mangrovi TaxID=2161747 RepID=UPI000D34AAB2|nr:PilZ domain-containing protein [Saccharospirillum mangrovi]